MKEDLLKIINFYGVNNQLRQFNEECFELIEAIINAENNRLIGIVRKPSKTATEHIKEEIADCLVMLGQFIEYYGITREELMLIERYKVNRQLDRIEEENENNK